MFNRIPPQDFIPLPLPLPLPLRPPHLSNKPFLDHNAPMQKPLEPELVSDRPEEDVDREAIRRTADVLARILDTAVQIPGTGIRIGLDPLLGLLPGIGDALASLVGSAILMMASQLRVPKIVMLRMSVNLLLNGVIGAVPVAGDFFSIWFKSNARNAELLRRHSRPTQGPPTTTDWAFVIGMVIAALTLTLGTIVGVLWVLARLWDLVR